MAKYSIRIKEIMENYYRINHEPKDIENFETDDLSNTDRWDNPFKNEYQNYTNPFEEEIPSVDTIIEQTWKQLFNFTIPELPNHSEGELEKKIIKHYYMREIGFETIERFKLALNETLNRIMPYYIELANSIELNGDNPLVNYEMQDDSLRKTDSINHENSNNTSNTTENNKNIFEDTPSNELSPDTNYATNISKANGTTNSTGDSEVNGTNNVTDNYSRNAIGLMGYSKQDMIARYRDNLINIDELIIVELRDLFMMLY